MPHLPVITSTLSPSALASFVQSNYKLVGQVSCELIRAAINHTYLITDQDKKYICRVYGYQWRTEVEIKEELRLLLLLQEKNVPVSFPIADIKKQFIQKIEAPEGTRYAVLFSFSKGKKERFLSLKQCHLIGTILANIHEQTAQKTLQRTTFTSKVLVKQAYEKLMYSFSEELPEMKYLKALTQKFSAFNEPSTLDKSRQGIVHLDLWYENFGIHDGENIQLYDFDQCGNGAFILDVAYFCMQLFCIETDKDVYQTKVDRFLEGYRTKHTLSDKEMQMIPEAAASIFIYYLGIQAQRFEWSNIFLSENYLSMYVGRIKAWLDYQL